jgi:hypothetical protein
MVKPVQLRFGGTFSKALENSSSPEFKAQAELVIAQVKEENPFHFAWKLNCFS